MTFMEHCIANKVTSGPRREKKEVHMIHFADCGSYFGYTSQPNTHTYIYIDIKTNRTSVCMSLMGKK